MRTTLTLDDEVIAFARSQAERDHISIGEALSRLARDGIRARHARMAKPARPKSKYALLPKRDEVITSAHVRALMDQEGI